MLIDKQTVKEKKKNENMNKNEMLFHIIFL